jgi:hypothetical protein
MLNEQQTTGMLQFAGLKPQDRAAYLEDVVSRPDLGGFNEGACVCVVSQVMTCCVACSRLLLSKAPLLPDAELCVACAMPCCLRRAADPAIRSFGISVDRKMASVNARILNPPLLTYAKPQALTPGTRVRPSVLCVPGRRRRLLCFVPLRVP